MDANDLNDASEETVEKGQGHDQQASPSVLWLVKMGQAVSGTFRGGPALLDQRAVPTQDRLGRDEERSPAFSRNKTGQEGDEGPVGPGEAGTGDLPVQHGQLMAEHEDLRLLGRGIHPMDANNLNDAPDETVEEGQGHGG